MRKRLRSLGRFGVLVAAIVVIAGCGNSGHRSGSAVESTRTSAASFLGPTANPPFPAKPLVLRDYQGHTVNLASYRGKAALVPSFTPTAPTSVP